MTDHPPLMALAAFFSPAFPTGSFAYSAGLEAAIAEGSAADPAALKAWLEAVLGLGSLRNDAILFAQAWREGLDEDALSRTGELALALCGSFERWREATDQGDAFRRAARPWIGALPQAGLPYAVVAGACCRRAAIACGPALQVFLQAAVSNLLQAAIRLSATGQNQASVILAALSRTVARTAAMAELSTPEDLGTGTPMAEIAALSHETLRTRLFLS